MRPPSPSRLAKVNTRKIGSTIRQSTAMLMVKQSREEHGAALQSQAGGALILRLTCSLGKPVSLVQRLNRIEPMAKGNGQLLAHPFGMPGVSRPD
jgi:hypothetical protein